MVPQGEPTPPSLNLQDPVLTPPTFAPHGKHGGDPRVSETVEDKMLVERGQPKGAGRQKLDIRGGREKGVFRCQKLANLIPKQGGENTVKRNLPLS